MKIVITGANGGLARELWHVAAQGCSDLGPLPAGMTGAELVALPHADLDITDSDAVRRTLRELRPDVVINCAAIADVDRCEDETERAFAVNALGPCYLARACDEIGSKLIHISSDYVFAGDRQAPYIEWDIPNPVNAYGKSKLLGEQYARENCRRTFIVRPAWIYGLFWPLERNFVLTILHAAREQDIIRVLHNVRSTPTNAQDLCHHIFALALTDEYGVYHCTNLGTATRYEMACEIVSAAGLDVSIQPVEVLDAPRPAGRPAFTVLDNHMLHLTIGDRMRSWQDALSAYLTHYDSVTGTMRP